MPRLAGGAPFFPLTAMIYIFIATTIAAIVWAAMLMKTSSALRADNARLSERLRMLESEMPERRKAEEDRFRTLASDLMERNSRMLDERHRTELSRVLDPLKSDIETFRKSVTECYDTEMRERHSLRDRIRELAELNMCISREAKDLSTALRGGGRVQGDWGEMVLETILEKSGLRRDEEFKVQQTIRDADGHLLRPDVVVYYPDGRCVVIDSKVSLTAFMDMTATDDRERQRILAQRHLQSVRGHIAELRRKSYQDLIGDAKTDFVMMFIPNEPAYIEAMKADPGLWQEAYDARVMIVSPTHLISALKLIEQLWRHDRQTRHALDIAAEAGKMYDKFVGFATDMDTIGKAMDRARTAYDSAMNKLTQGRGNLADRARALRDMGAKTTRRLPDPPAN